MTALGMIAAAPAIAVLSAVDAVLEFERTQVDAVARAILTRMAGL